MTPDSSTSRRQLLQVNQPVDLALEGGGVARQVVCTDVFQRNWSRVARAQAGGTNGSTDGAEDLFLKQFVDRRGIWHEDHWRYEEHGCAVARRALAAPFHVPALRLISADSLTLGYELLDLDAFDTLLRDHPRRFEARRSFLLEGIHDLMEALVAAADTDLGRLSTKQRDYDSRGRALCFKGLDVRNLGCRGEGNQMVAFDFGRPYLAPVEEAAAKLLVSIGLLNWGRPMSRFVRGPDRELLADAARALAPWTGLEATRAEIALQHTVRTQTIQGRRIESALKRWGVEVMGRRYLSKLSHMCEDLLG